MDHSSTIVDPVIKVYIKASLILQANGELYKVLSQYYMNTYTKWELELKTNRCKVLKFFMLWHELIVIGM